MSSGADKLPGLESAAAQLLVRAVELDGKRRFTEGLACYLEGIDMLMSVLKAQTDDAKKEKLRSRIQEYMARAEKLKVVIEREKNSGQYHEQIHIQSGSSGHSYEHIFRPIIDDELTVVEVDDPYIRAGHQLLNFVRFCEMLVRYAPRLRQIKLSTGVDENSSDSRNHQENAFNELSSSLRSRKINMVVKYSPTLHDREVRLNNGWRVKIGRGLDYFRSVPKYTLGYCDMDLRPCHETTVDIFHSKHLITN